MKIDTHFIDMRFSEGHGSNGKVVWHSEGNGEYAYKAMQELYYYYGYWTGLMGHPMVF